MPRSVYQVERIAFVLHLDSVAFDSDTALFLQVHIVQNLVLHIAFVHRTGYLEHTIRQRTFAVIDVCNDAKISYLIHYSILSKKIITHYALRIALNLCAAKLQKKCHFHNFGSFYLLKTPKFTQNGK